MRQLVALAAAVVLLAAMPAESSEDWMPTEKLRVCADGNLLPFSDREGRGFENKIAEMIGKELGLPVTYHWWPQTIGFVRNTLRARHCDLVVGTPVGEELMQNTNPYYRSTYALVYRADSGLKAKSLDDPGLVGARIGVVAQTPPASFLPRYGLTNIEPYQLNIDTRAEMPPRQAIEDVAAGKTDVAVIWGPVAGYHASRQDVPMVVVPLVEEDGPFRLQFMISMGIRPQETAWKHWLNDFIQRRQEDIDRLLMQYGVPILNPDSSLKTGARPDARAGLQ